MFKKMKNMKLVEINGNQISDEMLKEIQDLLEKEEKSTLLGPLDKNENDWTSEEFDEIKEFF